MLFDVLWDATSQQIVLYHIFYPPDALYQPDLSCIVLLSCFLLWYLSILLCSPIEIYTQWLLLINHHNPNVTAGKARRLSWNYPCVTFYFSCKILHLSDSPVLAERLVWSGDSVTGWFAALWHIQRSHTDVYINLPVWTVPRNVDLENQACFCNATVGSLALPPAWCWTVAGSAVSVWFLALPYRGTWLWKRPLWWGLSMDPQYTGHPLIASVLHKRVLPHYCGYRLLILELLSHNIEVMKMLLVWQTN